MTCQVSPLRAELAIQSSTPPRASSAVPLWRDVRAYGVAAQITFVVFLFLLGVYFYTNLSHGLAKFTNFSFDFLKSTASLPIAESPIPYDPHDQMYRAYIVGFLNTLRVIGFGIVLASIVGLLGGVARLSSNWLVAKFAQVYVEIFVDTPLLIQLYFWYKVGVLALPPIRDSIQIPGGIFMNNRGLTMPWYSANSSFNIWLETLGAGLVLSVVLMVLLGKAKASSRLRTGRGLWPTLAFVAFAVVSEIVMNPLDLSVPTLGRFNFDGGTTLSPEYVALTIGLVLYTGAFITEIVRAGIQAVPRGLNEASRALGLNYVQTLRLITVPIALRVIIPPLTNQYLNLTKNSSLAIAVAYPDLYFVGGGIYNQTGQTIQVIMMLMGTYLMLSLAISMIMNRVNAQFRLVER